MVAGSFTKDVSLAAPLERIWKAGVLDFVTLMPKITPDRIASIDIIEGNGGAGTIRQINFGEALKELKSVKDRVDVVDEANHVFKYSVIEGGGFIGATLRTLSYELKFEGENGGSTSLAKITVEFDTVKDAALGVEEQESIAVSVLGMMKGIEGYLLANPTAYA